MGGCVSDKTNGQLIFFGAGSMGHITGRNGNTLIGDWTNNPSGQLKFTATLATGSPPSPAAGGRSKAVSEPAPGGTGTVSSPDAFPADAAKVDVIIVNTAGNLSGITIVGEGERTVAQSTGELVAACWLIGPDTLPFKDKDTIKRMNEPKYKQQLDKLTAQEQLRACLYLVYVIQKGLEGTAGRTTSAAGGCRVRRLGFAIRRSAGHVVSVRLAKPTSTSVRYTCTASGGTAKITVGGRSKGGLRKALGAKLDLGVYRTKKAPRRLAKLTFAFGW